MANTNGYDASGGLVLPSESTIFRIGGKDIAVPALTLGILEKARVEILSLGPGLDFVSYARAVIKIVAVALENSAPELTEDALVKFCSAREMLGLAPAMNKLLEISGLGETSAADGANPGIGTSTESPQSLLSEESVAEIQSS